MIKTLQNLYTSYIRDYSKKYYRLFKELPLKKKSVLILCVGVFVIAINSFFSSPKKEVTSSVKQKSVTLKTIDELNENTTSLPLLGTVTSVNEATIRAESSGKLVRVYKRLGDYVNAGEIIAQFENSGERAALLQAEGVYEQAKAAREIARINSGTTGSTKNDARTLALTTISSAYQTMDDSIHVKTDTAFENPRTSDARFLLSTPDQSLISSIENQRKRLEIILTEREAKNNRLTEDSDLLTTLSELQNETNLVKEYLDSLSKAYIKAIPDGRFTQTSIDTGKVSINLARTQITGIQQALTGSKTSLTQSSAASQIASLTTGEGSAVTSSDAAVKQALGAYNGALSRLEKTIIRSPLSGTLNSLSIQTGDFIQPFAEVGVVSNNGSLEILSYVTENDAKRVIAGTQVSINEKAKGIITKVASALDPQTKKIEVRIAITQGKETLINGESVTVIIESKENKQTQQKNNTPLSIPLSALKMTPEGSYVLTVTASSSVVFVPVTTGAILGEKIEILSGVTRATKIIEDARGIKEGSIVIETN
jgi:HlyD family secretion protein